MTRQKIVVDEGYVSIPPRADFNLKTNLLQSTGLLLDNEVAMNFNIDNNLFNGEYSKNKLAFFKKVSNGYRNQQIEELKKQGFNEDSIFIAHIIGVYKGVREVGLDV